MKLLWIGIVTCFGLSGLAYSQPLLKFDELLLGQFGWPQLQPERDGMQCPDLTGRYAYGGDQYVQIMDGSEVTPFGLGKADTFIFFGNPPSARKGPDARRYSSISDDERSSTDVLWVKQSAETIEFRRRDLRDPSRIESMTWHRPADFNCERGLVKSRTPDAQGYSEGGAYEIRIEMALGRLSDGSLLLFNSTHYTSKALLIYQSTRRTATYSRFKPN